MFYVCATKRTTNHKVPFCSGQIHLLDSLINVVEEKAQYYLPKCSHVEIESGIKRKYSCKVELSRVP